MSRHIISVLTISIAVLILTACGVTQSTIHLDKTPTLPTSPSKNITINIIRVTDSREFVLSGDEPTVPQLASVKKINSAATATAAAQVRSMSGTVVADIFTENEVAAIVKNAVEESFRRAGYSVSASATNAIPVDVNITRFWAYNTGSWSFKFHFNISVKMIGDLPVLQKQKIYASSIMLSSAVGAGSWSYENTINKGMDKFIRELAAQLK